MHAWRPPAASKCHNHSAALWCQGDYHCYHQVTSNNSELVIEKTPVNIGSSRYFHIRLQYYNYTDDDH